MGDHSLTTQRPGLVPSTMATSTSMPLSMSSLTSSPSSSSSPYPVSAASAVTNPLAVNINQSKSDNSNSSTIQPSTGQRMISACAGSLLTSLLVTPLDVVKTRLQSQTVIATPTCAVPFTYTSDASAYEKLCTCCREVFFAPNQQLPSTSTSPTSTSTTATATAGLRQNAANIIAAAKRFSPRATSRAPPTSGALTGCGSSIIQQHQEGTVIGMKSSRLQQQRLEQLAANCIENNHISKAAQDRHFHGTWDGIKKIVRYEGASSLWRGLSPTVAMSIPATVIYFVGYDYLKEQLSEHMTVLERSPEGNSVTTGLFLYEYRNSIAPLAAGGFARTVAATVISPLELFRTRMQSVHTDTKSNSGLFRGVFQGVVSMVRNEGVLSLWRGLAPTLWRDVPFSAIYWMGYENIKRNIIAWDTRNHPLAPTLNEFEIAFASGALSGMIAATLTTPFDVAKTRRQVDLAQPVHTKMIRLMRAIVEEEGYRGLWRGLTARVAKVAPSCAIMISSYEIGKKALSEQWWGIGASSSSSSSSSSSGRGTGANSGSGNEVSGPPSMSGGGPEERLIHLRDSTLPRLATVNTASAL